MSELTDYYKNLLIVQYHNKPKAQATIGALVDSAVASGIIIDVRDGFNIDTALGAQLDIIGLYVGVDRFYTQQVLTGYFSYLPYSQVSSPPGASIGYATYADVDTKDGKYLTYDGFLSNNLSLNDADYRVLIKLKIIINNSNNSHKEIDESIYNFFGLTVIPDSAGNMVMDYFINGNNSAILTVAIQKNLLPKPMGVRLGYLIQENDPFFGLATYNDSSSLIEGFSIYADFDTKVGETLNYDKLVK